MTWARWTWSRGHGRAHVMATPKATACGADRKGKAATKTYDSKPGGAICPVCDVLEQMRDNYVPEAGTVPLWAVLGEPVLVAAKPLAKPLEAQQS